MVWSCGRNGKILSFHVIVAINGNYSDWSDWSECSRTCSGGIKTRKRECINPSPLYGGKDCKEIGSAFEKVHCNPQSCPGMTWELFWQPAFSYGKITEQVFCINWDTKFEKTKFIILYILIFFCMIRSTQNDLILLKCLRLVLSENAFDIFYSSFPFCPIGYLLRSNPQMPICNDFEISWGLITYYVSTDALASVV